MQNKKSIWSFIILAATIVSLILLITSIVLVAATIPAAMEVARQEAAAQAGATDAEIQLAISVATGAIIAALIISSLLNVLEIIGGFMFSLKGRWGLFCIVISLLSVAGEIYSLVNNIQKHAANSTIIIGGVTLGVSLLFCLACIMHYRENRA